jgi:hypothetical protein
MPVLGLKEDTAFPDASIIFLLKRLICLFATTIGFDRLYSYHLSMGTGSADRKRRILDEVMLAARVTSQGADDFTREQARKAGRAMTS